MKIVREFQDFAVRGNVVDMAVGIIIGGAFGRIATSLVNDVVMPPIGLLVGDMDFSSLAIVLRQETAEAEAVAINYGAFLNTLVNFFVVALVIFVVIRQLNRMKRQEAPKPVTTKGCPYCMSVIDVKASRCPQCTSHLEADAA